MKFSVALCTYNGERFLQRQLESIAQQLRPPDELVVCDDGSTDNTPQIVGAFGSTVAFPVHFHQNPTNLGSNRNFEKAIALCGGEIIVLCDQDDVWRADKLQRMERIFETRPDAGSVFSDAIVIDELERESSLSLWQAVGLTPQLQQRLRGKKAFATLLSYTPVTGATLAFRARFRPLILPIDNNGPLIHDAWIAVLLAAVSMPVAVPESLIFYRRHAQQQTHTAGQGPRVRTLEFYRAHLAQLQTMRARLREVGGQFDQGSLENQLRVLDEKIAHLQSRLALPARRAARIPPVLRELVSGRYRKHSNGWRSALRDFWF